MPDHIKGILAMASAAMIWGVSSIYYKALSHVPPLEVLSHRSLWSLVFLLLVLAVQGRLAVPFQVLRQPRTMGWIALASGLISVNWFLFIYSVQIGRAVDSSLGYFIFPLLSVLLGAVVLGERLSRLKAVAVALAGMAVLGLALALGVTPWIALILAITFAGYGLLKKQIPVGPVVSVTLEVLILLPLAAVWLWGAEVQGWQGIGTQTPGVFGENWRDSLLLVLSGILTGGPLILMSYASKRISLASLGLVMYINPTLQFLVAVAIFGEAITPAHMVAFHAIWHALALYSWAGFAEERSLRRAARKSSTDSMT
jgi:chloramphenicol-sensitive protein RarD